MKLFNAKVMRHSLWNRWPSLTILLLAVFGFGQTGYGQYCASSFSNTTDEWISLVEFSDLSNSSGSTSYSDFTGQVATVDAGISYPVNVTISQTGTFTEHAKVYIDWDQDEIFQVDEEYYLGSCASNGCILSGTVSVPGDALPGNTRMRVILDFGNEPASGGCVVDTYGETEDYTVNVSLSSCPPPLNSAVSNIGESTVDVNWDAVSGDVYVEYGLSPFTPGTDENANGGTIVGPVTSPEGLSGLAANSDYTVYIRQECSPGEWSNNATVNFTTACGTVVAPFFEDFEGLTTGQTNVFPNCWDNLGAKPWFIRNSQSTAFPTPYGDLIDLRATDHTTGSGSYMWADGSSPNFATDDGSAANNEVITPPIDMSALSTPFISFWVGSYYTGTAGNNELKLYAWDGADWELLTTYDDNTNDAWVEVGLPVPGSIPSVTQFRFVVWQVSGSSFYNDILIDDLSVAEAPSCVSPNNLTVDAFTSVSADISWDCSGCTGDYYVEYGAPGFTPGTGATAGGGTVEGPFTGTSTTISPLSINTEYNIFVRQDCGVDGFSNNSSLASVFTGACADGGPTSAVDSNVESVLLDGLGATEINHTGCPGVLGVENLTAQSADVSEIISFSLQIDYGTCGGNYSGAGSVWVDWNENLVFEPGELIGSDAGFTPPFSSTYIFTVPAGTPLGPKTMRVMQQEGGALPLDPCGTYSWGSVMDFTLNVVAPPACDQPVATFQLLADCASDEFSIEVDLTDAGSSTGGLVDITNDGGEPALTGVAPGTYVLGPFTTGTDVNVTVVNLDDNICNLNSVPLGTDCVLCTDGGPSSTIDSNIDLVEIDGFAGSGFSHVGCSPAVAGVEDLTALSVDIPNGFSYDLTVDLGTCGATFYTGAATVWVDWNGDFEFSASEVVGTSTTNPSSNTFTLSPPAGTPEGQKVMRVMQQEGGTLPFDPCASFTWGSVMDFTVDVIANPGCLPANADLTVDASSCAGTSFEYFINVDITTTGDSPGGEVTISNSFDGNTITNATVAGSPYVYGPFPSGTDLDISLEHGGNALCTYTTGFTYNCPPLNDDCADATVLTVNGMDECMGAAVSGSTAAATTDGPDPGACVIAGATDVWFEFTTGSSPYINWEITLGTMEAISVEIYDGCGSTNSLYCLADETSDPNTYVELEANTTYLFRVMTLPDFAGTFDLCIEEGPDSPQDNCVAEYSSTTPTLDVVGPIAGGEIISDLDLVIDLTNPNVGDLLIELISPCGTSVVLQDQACDGLTFMDVMYNDVSANSFTEFCPIGIGEVQPLEALGGFNNQPIVGTWTLSVTNATTGTAQAVNSWCLVPTLYDGCPPPQIVVTEFTDNSITVDSDPNSCYDPINFVSYDLQWTGGGSATGVTFPYEITGLDPGTLYIVDAFSNCSEEGSAPASGGAAQTTLNCAPEDLCTYELTLTNTDGDGWDGAFATVDNGWTVTDYVMDSDQSTQTWTVLACPGNAITLSVNNGGNGALSSNQTISFVNSDNVEVYSESGPPESTLYSQADGCPDCAAAVDIQFTRLAADLVELNWDNIALPGNVDNVQVIVLIEDFFGSTEIANETFATGTTSASVTLDGSYPFEDVTVQVITNCTNEGAGLAQTLTSLPGCDAADQCEYLFDMSSNDDGWINSGLEALIDGSISIEVALESGTSGSQSIYACPDGTIDVTADVADGSGIPDETCINVDQWPSGTVTIPNTGAVVNITTCNFGGEYSSLNLGTAGQYEFTSEFGTDYFTFTDASNNVIAAGPTPLTASIPTGGTYRLHVNTDSDCGEDSSCRTTTAQYVGPGSAGCDSYSFSLVLNPATDNITLVSETDFCDYDNGDVVYSGATCPSCFAPIDVVVADVADLDADFEWFSNNPAGTDYTVYVGLPGFTPGVDEVSSTSGTTVATGAQGPVNVSGLVGDTDYEVIVVEDCGAEESDPTPPVPFTTLISGDVCSSAISLTVQAGGGCPAGQTTNSFVGLSNSGDDISCLDFVPFPAPIDAFYTFNSGSLNAISLYVTMTAADYLIVDVYDGCSGEAVFCENGFGSPSIIEVDQNTDYIVRVISSENNVGDHSICVSPPSGCTDPNALNYNDLAEFDDGSCYSCGDATTLTVEANGDCPANEIDQDMTGADNSLGNFVECIGNTVPFLDEFYTFNSGTSDGVEITVSLGTMGFVAVEVYQECLGDAIFCANDNVGGTYGPIGVDQNTEYTVRISTIASEAGTYGVCVQDATPPSGCTDPNAVNFDPIAGIDDGSCILCGAGTSGIVLEMEDSFGDGWNGNTYTINDLSDPLNPVEVATGDLDNAADGDGDNFGTDYFCLSDGCYEITVGGGSFTGEVDWTLEGVDGGSVSGGAPETVQFTINGTCPVLGCTDVNALNYDPDATFDDGSCIVGDCNDPAIPFTYCYGNNENTSFTLAPNVPGDDIIVIFEQGTIESATFDQFTVYDGIDDSAPILYQNPAGVLTQLDGAILESTLGNGLHFTISTDVSGSCQSTTTYNDIIADVFCGIFVTPGCTDPNAVNYDEDADLDDGSCVLPPANDACVDAQTLTPAQYPNTQNTLGTLTGASQDGSSACVGTNGSDVFYTFNVPLENHYWVNLNPFGGFSGVVEVLDACDGTVVACENAPASAPFCDVSQSTAGFASDPGCEASVCANDAFCCNTSWDATCASSAALNANCTGCLSTAPAGSGPVSIFIENLPAGDYIVRVRDYYGNSYLNNVGQFLVNVQYFPFAGVQDNPNSFLYACNQGGFQLEDFVGATPQSGQGALDYQWYVYEEGGTFSNEWQRGEPNYVSRIFWLEMEYGNTYNVFVRILLDVPGVGPVWGVYPYLDSDPHAVGASECTISTASNVTPTELRPNYTPTNANGDLYAMCDFAIAYNVAESENFRWRFDPDTDPNNGNEIFYTRGVGNPSVRLSWVNGLLPGGIYNVAVEVMVDGQWSGYSTVLPIELALPPNNVVIRPQFCGGTYSPNGYILSESVCEADLYQFRFTPVGGGTPSFRNSGNYVCFMSAANPSLTPGDYDVQVKVTQNGVPGDWGPACTITIAGPQGQGGSETPTLRDIESTSTATLFPNPNAGNEVRVELSGLGDGNHEVNVNIYDVYGKLISTDGFGHEGSEMSRLIRFDGNLATGMYMVHVFVDGEQFTVERLVVK